MSGIFLRRILIGVIVVGGLLVAPTTPVAVIALAALTAYEEIDVTGTLLVAVGLIVMELLLGLDVGVCSLAYLFMVLVVLRFQRVISPVSWAHTEGWRLQDILYGTLLAWAAALLQLVGSVVVSVVLYRHGFFNWRIHDAVTMWPWWTIPLGCAIVMVVLRRMEVPFRRRTL